MKRIAVVGLYSIPNMGDLILCEATQYLIKTIRDDVEIVPVDVCPRYKKDYHGLEYVKYRISRKMKTMAEKKYKYEDNSIERYRFEYNMWRIRLYRYYKKKLSDVDAIMFAGGGFLKFRTQGLNYYVEMIIKIAELKNIPVMMNGVGIEGYDETDIRCQKLKKAINSDVVKVITTRDDIDILKEHYIENPRILISRVGDPALWTPECYNIQRAEKRERLGINIIRGKVFQDYGNKSSYEELKRFYKDLIIELDRQGEKWILFSNGMKGDQQFGREVLQELGKKVSENLLPAPKTSRDLLEMIRSFSAIFGARLHACITAYSMDVPVVGFIWNEKTRIFARVIKKSSNFFEESDMDVKKICKKLLEARHEQYETEIREEMKALTVKYMKQFLQEI